MEWLSSNQIIKAIRAYGEAGMVILGLDGFEPTAEGYIARLDLILDLSLKDAHLRKSPAALASEAEDFIRSRWSPNVVWEIVVDDTMQ